ncbi:hypothetical protein D3C86_2033160 [compost metagenome]
MSLADEAGIEWDAAVVHALAAHVERVDLPLLEKHFSGAVHHDRFVEGPVKVWVQLGREPAAADDKRPPTVRRSGAKALA